MFLRYPACASQGPFPWHDWKKFHSKFWGVGGVDQREKVQALPDLEVLWLSVAKYDDLLELVKEREGKELDQGSPQVIEVVLFLWVPHHIKSLTKDLPSLLKVDARDQIMDTHTRKEIILGKLECCLHQEPTRKVLDNKDTPWNSLCSPCGCDSPTPADWLVLQEGVLAEGKARLLTKSVRS